MRFPTMTVGGIYGSTVEAEDIEAAIKIAEGPGWHEKVLDVTEHGGETILVVAD
jgi:hypothetical protein